MIALKKTCEKDFVKILKGEKLDPKTLSLEITSKFPYTIPWVPSSEDEH